MALVSAAGLAFPRGRCALRSCVAVHICIFCDLQNVKGDEIAPIPVDLRKNKRRREHEEYVKRGRGGGDSQSRVARKAGNALVNLNNVLKGML